MLYDPDEASVAELIRTLKAEHRNASILNGLLQVLVSGGMDAFKGLAELTHEADPELRMYSALALGDLKDRRAIPDLIRLLHDSDINVRYHAIEAVSKLKAIEAAEELAAIATSGEFFLAFPALDALASIGDTRVASQLVPLIEDDMLRGPALNAIASLGDEKIVAPMLALLERHSGLAPVIAQALAKLHERFELMYGEGEYIADLARQHMSPLATEHLLIALNQLSGEVLRSAVRILGWIDNASAVRTLAQLLGSREVRSEVIETLVRHGEQVTGLLSQQLRSDDLETRLAAVMAIGRISSSDSVPDLMEALLDPDLAAEAAGALARIGDRRAYRSLYDLLGHDRVVIRQAAAAAINSLGDPRTPDDIRKILTDPDPYLRESAVRIAGYFGYPECADLMFERVNDPDANVRRAAVEGLANLRDDRVIPELLMAARDSSSKIRCAAAQSLGCTEDPAVAEELLRLLKDEDSWVRYYSARALATLQTPEAIDSLASLVRNDAATHVRIAAADALGAIGGPRVVSVLAPLVDAEDSDLARAVAGALGRVGHPDALQPILAMLHSQDPARRLVAVPAIGARRDRDAVEALQWAAAADEGEVSDAAIDELAQMATAESIAALVRLTGQRSLRSKAVAALSRLGSSHIETIAAGFISPQVEVRRAIVDALGRIKHPRASSVLSRALDDEAASVRLAAVIALQRMGSDALDRKLSVVAHNDPDSDVRRAAERALEK